MSNTKMMTWLDLNAEAKNKKCAFRLPPNETCLVGSSYYYSLMSFDLSISTESVDSILTIPVQSGHISSIIDPAKISPGPLRPQY